MKQIGRYEVLSELGRGAMGVVFKARDPLIGRLIALKTITASVEEDPGLTERFRTEAKAAGALQHPNIVTIHDVGEANGVPFIAMEYIEGESLAAMIARRSDASVRQKVGYLVETCRALQYAHGRGVIHRDIKPANIMVTSDGVVKVVDFGIARMAENPQTQTGTLLGTLAYMSPQQVRGKRSDARSDIWAVGVVLYELLSSRRPFRGENHAALLLSILQDDPVPLRELVAECPRQLETISRKALMKEDSARYQSMEEMLLELKSAWASLHLKRGWDSPAEAAHSAMPEYALQPAAGGAGTQMERPAEKVAPRNPPARSAPPVNPAKTKPTWVPLEQIVAQAQSPAPAPSSPTSEGNFDSAEPATPLTWQRGAAILGIALAVVTIALEATRIRDHFAGSTPDPAASDSAAPPSSAPVADLPTASQVSSTAPKAMHSVKAWPQIGCGVDAPAPESDIDSSEFTACGVLDPPKLQWVAFDWPAFPEGARQAGLVEGLAMLSLSVDERGVVVAARSRVAPDPFGFADSAMHAALKWKTTAPRAAGKPVRTQLSVDLPFSP